MQTIIATPGMQGIDCDVPIDTPSANIESLRAPKITEEDLIAAGFAPLEEQTPHGAQWLKAWMDVVNDVGDKAFKDIQDIIKNTK